jgi:hypothetical protein
VCTIKQEQARIYNLILTQQNFVGVFYGENMIKITVHMLVFVGYNLMKKANV